ncbi:MAG: FAD-dependent oxidoreductase [Bacteroidia bacterium]
MEGEKKIIIIGAGLVGSLLAIYLRKRGYKVVLYERRQDMRKVKIPAGRSINLALSDRGWRGLEGVGIDDEIRKIGIPMKGRMIHSVEGKITFQNYGKEEQAIYAVSRGILNCTLLNLAEKNGTEIHFNQRCTSVSLSKNEVHFEHNETSKKSSATADLIFGADGAFAASRLQLQLSTDKFNYSQTYLEHGYKELMFVANENGTHKLEKNALHIWPRGGYMLIALPNLDGTFTVTLFFPLKGNPSFKMLNTKESVKKFFNEVFSDAVPLLHSLEEDFFANPTGSLLTVKCSPWSFENKLVLIGDAAHAIVPFYGQGMNCGFEDCTILNQLIEKHNDDWQKIIPEYEALRKPAADSIAELAVNNFIEMRDLVGHPDFLLRKKIEGWFYEKHPDKWMPLYSMVTFSHIPYNEAQERGKKQDKIMDEVMRISGIENIWNSTEVERKILGLIK